jgi:hypothetical protein
MCPQILDSGNCAKQSGYYLYGKNIALKCVIENAPGAIVIKLFTAVSNEFSK